jgi:hypothetical protein
MKPLWWILKSKFLRDSYIWWLTVLRIYLFLEDWSEFSFILSVDYIDRLLLLFLHWRKLTINYIDPSWVCSSDFFLFRWSSLPAIVATFCSWWLKNYSVLYNSSRIWIIIDHYLSLDFDVLLWLGRIVCFWFWLHCILPFIHVITARLFLAMELKIMLRRWSDGCH